MLDNYVICKSGYEFNRLLSKFWSVYKPEKIDVLKTLWEKESF